MSEACLYLNIFTPNNRGNNLFPVMFWIHGGALIYGDSTDYDGSILSVL